MLRVIKKMLEPIQRRVMLMIAPATITAVDDSKAIQKLQIKLGKDEVRENINHIQQYGFTSHPKPQSECAVIFVGGNRDHGLVIAVDDSRYRLKSIGEGEVALYSDEGDVIHLKRGNKIEIKSATSVRIDAPDTTITGNVSIAGNVSVAGTTAVEGALSSSTSVTDSTSTMQAMRTIYNGHKHGSSSGPAPTM